MQGGKQANTQDSAKQKPEVSFQCLSVQVHIRQRRFSEEFLKHIAEVKVEMFSL